MSSSSILRPQADLGLSSLKFIVFHHRGPPRTHCTQINQLEYAWTHAEPRQATTLPGVHVTGNSCVHASKYCAGTSPLLTRRSFRFNLTTSHNFAPTLRPPLTCRRARRRNKTRQSSENYSTDMTGHGRGHDSRGAQRYTHCSSTWIHACKSIALRPCMGACYPLS